MNNKIDVVAKFLDRDYKGMKNITPVLREIYKNYAILSDGEYDKYPNIIVYDIEKNIKYCEISLPKENYPNRMFACAPVNSKLYGIFPADHDRDKRCEWTDIYEIDIENIKTKDRNLSYVTQYNRLFPMKTVFDNIAFPLKMRRINKTDIEKKFSRR